MRLVTATLTALVAAALPLLDARPARAVPAADFEMPFPCGQTWSGDTRPSHSPSPYSLDFNRPEDLGDPVVASAAGVVSHVGRLGSRSYGTYVVLDHGGGESTLYAHLQDTWLVPGQQVDQGTLVGLLGGTGGVTGPHLHYEQRLDGRVHRAWFGGTPYTAGTVTGSRNCADTPVTGDWDGDGRGDLGVYRRLGTGRFRTTGADGAVDVQRFGRPTDQPLVGDWDGDDRDDLGVRRPLSRSFILRAGDGTRTRVVFGNAGDQGVAGDWDGDGRSEVGVWRPATATFLLRHGDGTSHAVRLGDVGSVPATGDWNGDRRTDLGTFAPSTGTWSLRMATRDGTVWAATVAFGGTGDLPAVGDWDGDRVTDLGLWSPATATYTLRTADPLGTQAPRVATRRLGRAR